MKVNNTRRKAFAGLAVAAILGTTGCSAINPQATTYDYAPSDGTQTTIYAEEADQATGIHQVEFLDIAVITSSADEPGVLMGMIHNKTADAQNVELQINDETFSFTLESGEMLSLEEEEIVIDQIGTEPGLLADGVASALGTSDEFYVTVLPPRLEEYRDLYPGEVTEEQIEHLYDFQGQYHDDDE